jgi:glycosyltransferase involved in cell wall biosynthesis
MIVKDEEKLIENCIDHIAPHVDELLIADTGSTDGTLSKIVQKSKQYPCLRYMTMKWPDSFSAARNQVMAESGCDWFLILDADEELHLGDGVNIREEIRKIVAAQEVYRPVDIVSVMMVDLLEDGQESMIVSLPRLMPNRSKFFDRYEYAVHNTPKVDGCVSHLPREKIYFNHLALMDSERRERRFKQRISAIEKRHKEAGAFKLDAGNNECLFAWAYLIDMQLHGRKYGECLDTYFRMRDFYGLEVLKANPMVCACHYRAAVAALQLRCPTLVLQICHEALRVTPDNIDLHYMSGIANLKLSWMERAANSFVSYLDYRKRIDPAEKNTQLYTYNFEGQALKCLEAIANGENPAEWPM